MKWRSRAPGPEVITLFSCSTQLRSKFILLINVKMPTIVGILTFISRINDWLLWFKPEISIDFGYFSIHEQLTFHAQLSWERKKFYNIGARSMCVEHYYYARFHFPRYHYCQEKCFDMNCWRTNERADGRTESWTPIWHPAISRCNKKECWYKKRFWLVPTIY